MYKHTLLIGNGFGSLSAYSLHRDFGLPSEGHSTTQPHTDFHQRLLSGMMHKCLLLFLIGFDVITLPHQTAVANLFLIFKAVDRRRNSSAAVNKCLTGELVYRHDRSVSQKAAKFNSLSDAFSRLPESHVLLLFSGLPYQ